MIVHILESADDWDAIVTNVRAQCGATAIITDDGEVAPPEFDFVEAPDEILCDCEPCLRAAVAKQRTAVKCTA